MVGVQPSMSRREGLPTWAHCFAFSFEIDVSQIALTSQKVVSLAERSSLKAMSAHSTNVGLVVEVLPCCAAASAFAITENVPAI